MRRAGISAPAPSVLFAHILPNRTRLNGVRIGQPQLSIDTTAGLRPFFQVNSHFEFPSLFRNTTIPFTEDEMRLIDSASEEINQRLAIERNFRNGTEVVAQSALGYQRARTNLTSELVPTDEIKQAWSMGESFGGVDLPYAIYEVVKAFSLGLIRGASITINTGDWHSYMDQVNAQKLSGNYTGEGNNYSKYARAISNAIANGFRLALTLQNPFRRNQRLSDHLLIMSSSEFSRSLNALNCNNHGDGTTNAVVLFGKNVNNTSAYNWEVGSRKLISINAEGKSDANAPLFSLAQGWATFCAAAGIPASVYQQYATGASPITALLKT
jgi:hypothetical protein